MRKSNYPLYQTIRVDNLKELLTNCAARYADRVAFQYRSGSGTARVSFQQFQQDVECLGTAFMHLGWRNRHIAVLGENSYKWITTYFAAIGSSNVIVPVDPELPPLEMKNILQGSDAAILVYSPRFAGLVPDLARQAGKLECLIGMEADADTDSVRSYPRLLELGRQLLEQGERSFIDNPADDHCLAAIIYTSGTTGASKGVMLSQYNMASNVVASTQHLSAGASSLLVLPLHHTFGWTAGVLCMLHIGATISINTSLKNVIRDMSLFQPAQMCLVPLYLETMYKRVWSNAHKQGKERLLRLLIALSNGLLRLGIDQRRRFFESLRLHFGGRLNLVICGGAHLDPKYVRGFRELGITILNGYGLTECSPCVTSNRNEYYRDESIGLPLPGVEVRINDPDGQGEGEIWVKGPNVMLGYYGNPAATADTMAGEWLKTGDIGRMDREGFVYITGRIKNMIKLSSGINIYPEELEALIADIPYVKDVLVYGRTEADHPEPRLTAEICLDADYILDHRMKNPEGKLKDDIDALNKSLPYYKKISDIRFRSTEFDKTTTRKIKRFKIVHGQ